MTNRVPKVLTGIALLTAVIAVVDIRGAHAIGMALALGNAAYFAALAGCAAIAVAATLIVLSHASRYRERSLAWRWRELALALLCIVTIAAFSQAIVVLDYLCVALAPPSIEAGLVRFDALLGFHWPDLYRWVRAHAELQSVLAFAYHGSIVQLIAVPFMLSTARRHDDLAEFMALFAFALLVVVAVSTPFPAQSAFVHFGIADANTASTVSHYDLLRSGQLRRFSLSESQGLVSLPSFHVMLALLFVYAVRHFRYVFPASVVLNVAMIVSTPTQGGHYLADVIAGIAFGVLSIVVVRRWMAGPRRAATTGPRATHPT
ncbi:phosphatase PAP2 family protein [Burkholderia lata]|uniref:PAP2 family protein n=1 Tax=Burkholderia lata (strain ATCC 17760 / DSM 23089 / LMG 22485 / NCIMB 9086 / R18194 / 383) TaxID=482957 RepID=A0A6P2UVU1_BURL3|nr:phosphatase PAP2 family protein [Burkholderia lata]VWC74756.1 PAP2 family protein [Burkholderia lata]